MTSWVRTYEHERDYMESVNGVLWADAPLPRRWHRCRPQTRGWIVLNYTERCACGATRLSSHGSWVNRNETRKARARQRREDRLPRVQVTCDPCGQQYEAASGTPVAIARLCDDCWADRLVNGRKKA